MTQQKRYTREELAAVGITERNIVDRSTHPAAQFITWDVTKPDAFALGKKAMYRLPHVRPESILIAPIGNLWEENTWWRLQDAALAAARAGHSISWHEQTDHSFFSWDAIPQMRWSSAMLARDSGVQWCLMVDNDALLEKDTILRLVAHDRPVVFPIIEDLEQRLPELIAPLSMPRLERGKGLQPVVWSAMSCMLFNPKIFNVLDPLAWRGSDYHFAQALNYIGHRIYVDTDTVVKVVRGPTRHAHKEYDEFWDGHREMWDRLRNEERNRHAPPGWNPAKDDGYVDKDGTYFGVPRSTVQRNGEKT